MTTKSGLLLAFSAGALITILYQQLTKRSKRSKTKSKDLLVKNTRTIPECLLREQLARNYAFYGEEGMNRIRQATVIVVGVGGVGSQVSAILARSGIAHLRIIDFDQVTLSSLNRHALAGWSDVGCSKVEVMQRHLAGIAPACQVETVCEAFKLTEADRLLTISHEQGDTNESNASTNQSNGHFSGHSSTLAKNSEDGSNAQDSASARNPNDNSNVLDIVSSDQSGAVWIVDCIDNIDSKVELLSYCHKNGLNVVASMGAGAKADPTRVRLGDLGCTSEDALSRACRLRLKRMGIHHGIPVVYSEEVPSDALGLLPLRPDQQESSTCDTDTASSATDTTCDTTGSASIASSSSVTASLGSSSVGEYAELPSFRVRILPVTAAVPLAFASCLANYVLSCISLGAKSNTNIPEMTNTLNTDDTHLVDSMQEMSLQASKAMLNERPYLLGAIREVSLARSTGTASQKDMVRAYKDFRIHERKVHSTDSIHHVDLNDVTLLFEVIWRHRSVLSSRKDRLLLVRWNPQLPATWDNLILLCKDDEVAEHDELSKQGKSLLSDEQVAAIRARQNVYRWLFEQ